MNWLEEFVAANERAPRYDELVVLPGDMVRRIVPALSPEDQASFWQGHLSLALESERDPSQREVLEGVIARLTPDLFRRMKRVENPELLPEIQLIQKNLLDAFPRNVVGQMLSPTLRPAPSPARSTLLQLPPERQFDIWQAHLRSFLDLDLTQEQRGALLRVISLLTPDLFARQQEGPQSLTPDDQRVIQEIEEALSRAFSPAEQKVIGSDLGRLQHYDIPQGAEEPEIECDCKYGSIFSCGQGLCLESQGRCEIQSRGCGLFFLETCNGGCCVVIFDFTICPWGRSLPG